MLKKEKIAIGEALALASFESEIPKAHAVCNSALTYLQDVLGMSTTEFETVENAFTNKMDALEQADKTPLNKALERELSEALR